MEINQLKKKNEEVGERVSQLESSNIIQSISDVQTASQENIKKVDDKLNAFEEKITNNMTGEMIF